MAKKKGKKRGQGWSHEQSLLRAHARRVMPNLPPGAQLRVEPKGEQRMSEVLEAFVEPYLGLTSAYNGQRVLLQIAALAWNAAILPEDRRLAMLDQLAETGLPGFQGQVHEELLDLVKNMIARNLAFFDENKRFILSVEVTGA